MFCLATVLHCLATVLHCLATVLHLRIGSGSKCAVLPSLLCRQCPIVWWLHWITCFDIFRLLQDSEGIRWMRNRKWNRCWFTQAIKCWKRRWDARHEQLWSLLKSISHKVLMKKPHPLKIMYFLYRYKLRRIHYSKSAEQQIRFRIQLLLLIFLLRLLEPNIQRVFWSST
jgi:hypothetical protein